jgi:hypothetical protein
MFATRIKAKILRLEIFLILETNQHKIKEKVIFNKGNNKITELRTILQREIQKT